MQAPTTKEWVAKHTELLKTALWIICFLIVIIFMQNKDASAVEHAAYVKALEDIITKCTNIGDNAIIIDNEIYMCGAARTGIKVNQNDKQVHSK